MSISWRKQVDRLAKYEESDGLGAYLVIGFAGLCILYIGLGSFPVRCQDAFWGKLSSQSHSTRRGQA